MPEFINISLVGGQSMPVHIGITAQPPDQIVLVHSSSSKEEAMKIAAICGIPHQLEEYPLNDYPSVLSRTKSLLDKYAGKEVSVNVSSGTKHWAIAFSLLAVGREHVSIFYIDQNNYLHDITNHLSRPLNLQLDTNTILRYHNQKDYSYSKLEDYTDADKLVLNEVVTLRNRYRREFGMLTLSAKDRDWGKELETSPCPRKRLQYPYKGEVVFHKSSSSVAFAFFDVNNIRQEATLSSPRVGDIVFNAGWYEYQIAQLLSGWSKAKEIWLNVKFPYINGDIKNEIDIIVNMGNKLLFVECKTNIYNNTDIDKFRTAVKTYGGMGSKALFITESIRDITKEKCKDCGIMSFSYYSNTNRKKRKNSIRKLYEMLDKELPIINKG